MQNLARALHDARFGDVAKGEHKQRLFYTLLAAVLLGLSVERYPRLSQGGTWRQGGRLATVATLLAAVGLFVTMRNQDAAALHTRAELLRAHVTRSALPAPAVSHYDLDVHLLGDDRPLAVTADLRVRNPNTEPIAELLFTLNPGLELRAVRDASGDAMIWERDGSVVEIALGQSLAPEGEVSLTLEYAGDIDRNGFDLLRTAPRVERDDGPMHMPELTAWIRDNTVYLPARSAWYPTAGVDYGHEEPPLPSYATAEIAVTAPATLQIITQGVPQRDESSADDASEAALTSATATTTFTVERAVPVLSLNAGTYRTWETRIGDLDLALYVHPDHASKVQFFEDATAEVIAAVEQLRGAMERETGMRYPYGRLNVVEVPFVVQWYYEGWREVGGLTQPGVLMVEEDVFTGQRFERDLRRRQQESQDEVDVGKTKRDLLVASIFQLFLSPESDQYGLFRSPLVQLWSFDRAFVGQRATLLERGMPVYLQQDVGSEVRSMMLQRGRGGFAGRLQARGGRPPAAGGPGVRITVGDEPPPDSPTAGGRSDWDATLEAMQRQSFSEMNPDEDPELYRSVLDVKSISIFRMMKAVVGADAFVEALEGFADESRYGNVDFASFEKAIVSAEASEDGVAATGSLVGTQTRPPDRMRPGAAAGEPPPEGFRRGAFRERMAAGAEPVDGETRSPAAGGARPPGAGREQPPGATGERPAGATGERPPGRGRPGVGQRPAAGPEGANPAGERPAARRFPGADTGGDLPEDPEERRAIMRERFAAMRAERAAGAAGEIPFAGRFPGGTPLREPEPQRQPQPEPNPHDSDLERLVAAWLDGTSVPGYELTRATARKVEGSGNAVTHQVVVRVRNGEPGLGFVEVKVSAFGDEVTKGVQIEGGTEVEVALVIAARPTRVSVEPFFAKNRRPLVAPLRVSDEVEAGPPESYVHLVTEDDAPFVELIVDNEDEGFSMPARHVQRYFRPGLAGDNWYVRSATFAFGRYETNYRYKNPGDGALPAVWQTTVPRTGEYDVAFYFLPPSIGSRRTGVSGLASEFDLTLVGNDEAVSVKLDTSLLRGGWNLIGRFTYEEGDQVSVELSDRADGRLYADAIRWRYIDPEQPARAYEEEIAPWEFRARPGGPGGAPRRSGQ